MKVLSNDILTEVMPKILDDQTRFAYSLLPILKLVTMIAIVLISYLGWKSGNHAFTFYWCAAAVITIPLNFILYFLYRSANYQKNNSLWWGTALQIGCLISGLIMLTASFILFPDLTAGSKIIFMLLMMSIVTIALTVLAINLKVYAIFILLHFVPFIQLLLENILINTLILGALGLYSFMLLLAAQLFQRALVDSFAYNYHAELLNKNLQLANNRLFATNQELQKISVVDELTKVYNRRYFNQRYQEAWLEHVREQKSLSLLMLDVDYFKLFNDTFGHVEGDKCLQKIAKELMYAVHRPRDLVARFGGEEFIVMLPNTGMAGARELALRIHRRIEQLGIRHNRPDKLGRVSVSIGGGAITPDKTMNMNHFIDKVDMVLYQAKQKGRNTSVFIE